MVGSVRVGIAATWCNAWLAQTVSLDVAAAHVAAVTGCPYVTALPGEDGTASWPVALGRLRGLGVARAQLALPAPGDPLGLAGPPAFNAAALAAGSALLAVGGDGGSAAYGLLPPTGSGAREFTVSVITAPLLPASVAEAGRDLAAVVRQCADELDRLEVARAHTGLGQVLAGAERLLADHPPAATSSPRAADLLRRAARLLGLAELAGTDDGGAVSAAQAQLRSGQLRPLSAAARRALVAACSDTPRTCEHPFPS